MTYQQITSELYPAFMQLIQAQNSGLVQLPQKVAYAFGKSFTSIQKHGKHYTKLRNELVEQYVLKDEQGNYKTVKVGTQNEYEFAFDQKPIFIEKVNELANTEVDCKLHTFSRQELESINNFPIQIFPVLEEYGMITELHLEKPKLQLAN